MSAKRVRDRGLDAALLQVDVRAGRRRRDERERVLERRPAAQSLMRGVREHEHAVDREDVELDGVGVVRERGLDRLERVLRRERGGAAMSDPQDGSVAAKEPHGAVGSRSSSSRPPCAAYARIIRSVTHSTGA